MSTKTIGVVLFDGFETLDVYGPLGLLVSAALDYPYKAVLIGPPNPKTPGSVLSSSLLPTPTTETLKFPPPQKFDVLLIPGGFGNRPLLNDTAYLNILEKNVEAVLDSGGTILCVCTGSVLLAATGLLDGKRATTNKKAYDELTPKYLNVWWRRQARWVVNGQIITSSGITAGMVCRLHFGQIDDDRMPRCICWQVSLEKRRLFRLLIVLNMYGIETRTRIHSQCCL